MPIKNKLLLILLFLSSPFCELHSQTDMSCFSQYCKFSTSDSSKLFFRIENFNFVKNNEFKSNITKGATWMGYLISPKMLYYLAPTVRLEAGVRLQKFSGLNNYSQEEPLLTLHYQPAPCAALIMGSLNNNKNHNLPQPLYNQQRYFTNPAENGIQFIYNSTRMNVDTWIKWDKFIFDGDPFQERLTFGVSGKYKLTKDNSTSNISVPLHILISHRGGEIDNSPDPVQTIINSSTGLSYQKKCYGSTIKSWGINTLVYYYKDNSPTHELNYDKGHALYPQIDVNTTYGQVKIGYWNGYHFISPKGMLLYQSATRSRPLFKQSRIELITTHYNYSRDIAKGVCLGFELDLYIKNNAKTDVSTALYIAFNRNFFLRKIKRAN